MNFEYSAKNINGEVENGLIKADSFKDALIELYNKRLFPIDVKQLSDAAITNYSKIDNLKKLKSKLEGKPVNKQVAKKTANISIKPAFIIAILWMIVVFFIACLTAIL